MWGCVHVYVHKLPALLEPIACKPTITGSVVGNCDLFHCANPKLTLAFCVMKTFFVIGEILLNHVSLFVT